MITTLLPALATARGSARAPVMGTGVWLPPERLTWMRPAAPSATYRSRVGVTAIPAGAWTSCPDDTTVWEPSAATAMTPPRPPQHDSSTTNTGPSRDTAMPSGFAKTLVPPATGETIVWLPSVGFTAITPPFPPQQVESTTRIE